MGWGGSPTTQGGLGSGGGVGVGRGPSVSHVFSCPIPNFRFVKTVSLVSDRVIRWTLYPTLGKVRGRLTLRVRYTSLGDERGYPRVPPFSVG